MLNSFDRTSFKPSHDEKNDMGGGVGPERGAIRRQKLANDLLGMFHGRLYSHRQGF